MSRKSEKKVEAVLRGDLVRNRTPGTWLVNLYRGIVSGHNINDAEWNTGIHQLVDRMVKYGELDETKKPHKPGNLNNALCDEEMTWRTFVSGIRLVVLIRIKQIARVKLSISFERRVGDNLVETEYTTTLHEDKKLLDLNKKP